MKRLTYNWTSAAANLVEFASNVTGASFALTNLVPSDGMAHKITVRNDSVTDHSGKTLALVGTCPNGGAQTETLTMPGTSATVTSSKYWGSLATPLVPSATIGADTMDIGMALESVGPWVPVANYSQPGACNMSVVVSPTAGAPTYTLQSSCNDLCAGAVDHSTMAAKANVTDTAAYTSAISSVRLKFTAAGSVTFIAMIAHL